jgi:hypothetical protein
MMRRVTNTLLFLMLVLLGSSRVLAQVPEFLLYDETFTWTDQTGGDGCQGFHYWTDLGGGTYTNWKSPYDFQNGTFYFRYEIIEQPALPGGGYHQFGLSFCIWSAFNGSTWKETCADPHFFNGPGSVVTSAESPANWFVHAYGNIDWTNLGLLWHFGNPTWYDGSTILASANCTSAPADIWNNHRGEVYPLKMRMTIVAVAQGHSFSGWDYYLNGGGTARMPTPTYTIDYTNKRTAQVVPSTDEYANNSGMTGASSGNGSAVTLTPGQNIYFRTKASGENLASYVQTLSVPSKPAAPTFGYDIANQRTSSVVSSAYEYSTNADMSGAVTGSGNYVSFATGTTRYFRKKATSSAFESNIQTLQGVDNPAIGPEFIILRDTIDYPNTTDNNGFYFFYHNSSMPVNWTTPYDYYNGQVYTRYEIISQATSTPVGLQFGIWQKLPPVTGTLYETMGNVKTMSGPGSVVTNNSSPNTWWKLDADGNGSADNIDWTQMDKVWHFGINPWKLTPTEAQIRQENASIWAERYTYWYPMKVYVIVVAVASGHSFSGWDAYLETNKPATPSYAIDFANEQTNIVVASTDEYSLNSNMSAAANGTGVKVALVPGQNIYFRTKAAGGSPASDIQQLVVPDRPASPTFAIDYSLETTSTVVSSEYEYSVSANMSSASSGSGVKLTITPGTNRYFRKKATASSFKSAVQTLAVPIRPTIEATVTDILHDPYFVATVVFPGSSAGFTTNEITLQNCTITSIGVLVYKVEPLQPGFLTMKVDANATTAGNFASNEFRINYSLVSGIDLQNASEDIHMYPSPVKDMIKIVTNKEEYLPLQVRVFDVNGKLYYAGELKTKQAEIDCSKFPSGLYFVTFNKQDLINVTKKFVKE